MMTVQKIVMSASFLGTANVQNVEALKMDLMGNAQKWMDGVQERIEEETMTQAEKFGRACTRLGWEMATTKKLKMSLEVLEERVASERKTAVKEYIKWMKNSKDSERFFRHLKAYSRRTPYETPTQWWQRKIDDGEGALFDNKPVKFNRAVLLMQLQKLGVQEGMLVGQTDQQLKETLLKVKKQKIEQMIEEEQFENAQKEIGAAKKEIRAEEEEMLSKEVVEDLEKQLILQMITTRRLKDAEKAINDAEETESLDQAVIADLWSQLERKQRSGVQNFLSILCCGNRQ